MSLILNQIEVNLNFCRIQFNLYEYSIRMSATIMLMAMIDTFSLSQDKDKFRS